MIQFNNTYFSYDGKPLISGFSVNIAHSEKVVIYGPSGSGKSTLVHAILGFVQPEQGEITVNNLPLSHDTINEIRNGAGQLITVVGCGGNRDKGKRPMMAREAIKGSDRVIFISDNPRKEDPQAILDDMTAELTQTDMRNVLVVVDRRQAIRTACQLAQPGDVVLVAGKGHENYQIIGDVKHHFDDREELLATN